MLFGEKLEHISSHVHCMTNLSVLQQKITGRLILTNYRAVFRPYDLTETSNITQKDPLTIKITENTMKVINKPYINEYFNLPYGIIFSVEAKTPVKGSNKLGDSFVEITTKDGRNLKVIVSDPIIGEGLANRIS